MRSQAIHERRDCPRTHFTIWIHLNLTVLVSRPKVPRLGLRIKFVNDVGWGIA
jgi:hypothetical protein